MTQEQRPRGSCGCPTSNTAHNCKPTITVGIATTPHKHAADSCCGTSQHTQLSAAPASSCLGNHSARQNCELHAPLCVELRALFPDGAPCTICLLGFASENLNDFAAPSICGSTTTSFKMTNWLGTCTSHDASPGCRRLGTCTKTGCRWKVALRSVNVDEHLQPHWQC
jgi:hypothetical protein